ncbi:galactonate dehydratase, partial [Streptomyces regensis]
MIDEIRSVTVAPRWILVRVRTSDGVTGWGEAIVPKRARAVCAAVAELDRVLHGADERRIEELWHRARDGAFFRDGSVLATAAAGVEHALWDIKARRLGVPVHDLLGGPVRDRVRVYAWIAGDRPGDVVDQARTRVGQGYGAVKMNATAEFDLLESPAAVDEVVARVGALRDEFGTELDIALDFHGRVHRSMVAPLLRELEQFRL